MTDKQLTYSKQVIEMADFIFANPDRKISSEISVFCSKFQKTERTIWNYVKKAQEYNKIRLQKQEEIKEEVLVANAREAVKKAILNREECLEILSSIAKGSARKVKAHDQVLIPSDNERTGAIKQLSKMEGWDAPTKTELAGTNGEPLFGVKPLTKKELLKFKHEIREMIG